jgi:NAD(P)-dependent dehydrogenase (short-subunit alcohol dehydrogenase family)
LGAGQPDGVGLLDLDDAAATKDASSYSVSKWGILGLMKSAAIELGEHNITVNALIPGLVGRGEHGDRS